MPEMFTTTTIQQLAKRFREPGWLTDLRRTAWSRHAELPWPHPSDEVWRRLDVSLLDPLRGFAPTAAETAQRIALSEEQLDAYTKPLGNESLAVRANGDWLVPPQVRDAAVEDLGQALASRPDPIQRVLMADGLTAAEQKLATLNTAFHHDDVVVQVPADRAVETPIRLVHLSSVRGRQALFPVTLVLVGAGSRLTLIDEYVSLPSDGTTEPHLINGRIELVVEPNAKVHYVRLQRWGPTAREFVLLRATLGAGASLTMANLNLGAALSKAHLATRFTGAGASSQIYGFVLGRGTQHIDQHTLQDHQAPQTTSDLQFRAALRDQSRMVYTGLIRIAKEARQTNAYQSNHNLLLSQGAQAETIPMLEILADDVQCKHGASIGPIDEEQVFYLMSRGIPRGSAERLGGLGVVEPIIQQVPFPALQERLRDEIERAL